MRLDIWRRLFALSLLFALSTSWGQAENAEAREVRLQLVTAFSHKDPAAIRPLVSDPWSGLRYHTTWSDSFWQAAADGLRDATVTLSGPDQVAYEVTRSGYDGRTRKVKIQRLNSVWLLDLNSLVGPFPITYP